MANVRVGLAVCSFAAWFMATPAFAQSSAAPPPAAPADVPSGAFERWLDVQSGTIATRFRYQESAAGGVAARHIQYTGQAGLRLKLDARRRVTVSAVAQTGSSFAGSWNTSGVGTGDFTRDVAVRQLFVTVTPAAGVEFSLGSLPPARGMSSEVTTYDNDGYLTGERLVLRRRPALWFDDIVVTSARLGDLTVPSAWSRLSHFADDRNYLQVAGTRTFGRRLSASLDLTRLDGRNVVRAALLARTPLWRVVDTVRLEGYSRFGTGGAGGGAGIAEKVLAGRLTLNAGLQRIDKAYPPVNGDRYLRGTRVFATAALRLTPELTLQAFAADRAFDDHVSGMRRRFDLVLQYNAAAALKRAGVIP